jgi:hypothetical protein
VKFAGVQVTIFFSQEEVIMSDPLSFILFFFVVVPFILIHLYKQRVSNKEMLDQQKETNLLLKELTVNIKKN